MIMEYLEERYPEPALLAADPADRALARLWIFRHDDFTRPYYALRRGEDGAAARFDAELGEARRRARRSGRGSAGAEYGLADIAYVPWVLRARDMLGVPLDGFPALVGVARPPRSSGPRSREEVERRCSTLTLPRVVDAAWLAAHLDDADLVVGDVRGPNAHARGHIPGSRPLVLGSPPPGADGDAVAELAKEVALRLRRHGITGDERLVLVDRGDGVGAMPAAQMAELAGHPRVAILLGGIAAWPGELAEGTVELEPVREASLEPNPRALPTRQELASRLDDPALTILDVRREEEYTGKRGNAVRPAAGPHPGREARAGRSRSSRRRAACSPPERDPRARRRARRRRDRRVLPLRLALGARDARAAQRRLRRAQLRGLVARVEPAPRAPARALGKR